MGAFISKDCQEKYTRKVRFWAVFEALQQPSLLLGLLIGVVSVLLSFLTQAAGLKEL